MQKLKKKIDWGTPIIDVEYFNCPEKNYTDKEITKYFLDAMEDVLAIFDEYNKRYDKKALEQEEKANRNQEARFYLWLCDCSKIIRKVLKESLAKYRYKVFIYFYEDLHKIFVEKNEFNLHDLILDDPSFENFESTDLLKWGLFLYAFAQNIYCFLCFYYENLNRKYYFKFETLKELTYTDLYFNKRENPNLLKVDDVLLKLCFDHCTPLEKLLYKWGYMDDEIKGLLIKPKKWPDLMDCTDEQIKQNFLDAMAKIGELFENRNRSYYLKINQFVTVTLKNEWDFVMVQMAFNKYAGSISEILKNPFIHDVYERLKDIIYDFEHAKIEDYLAPNLSEEEKNKFISNLERFYPYKKFLHAFARHIDCYLRFYYETLNRKYYFCFENLFDVCYVNADIEEMNEILIKTCNKKCKPLTEYLGDKK